MEINGIEVDVDLRYSEMNLSQGILKALDQKGFTLATPVQAGAIPCFKDWKDVMAKAPTGSGKTFAFGIPMVEHTGQQNQLEVILALSQGADYILMDEPFAGNDLFNREDFYKVLVGILEPQETLLLSTHLLEETAPFLSRALLLRQGTLVADLDPLALEETGADLLSYVKRAYHYQADRVSRALTQLTNGKEPLP